MQYGVQRRSIYLVPPTEDDLAWMLDRFDEAYVWKMFGFDGPSKARMKTRFEEGNLVTGIIRRVEDERRIGFSVTYPPTPFLQAWEFSIVIPDEKERDLYSAMHASDIVAHYMFDHCGIERAAWRVREDNPQPAALAKRMGYKPYATFDVDGARFRFFRLPKERWQERHEKLVRGELEHPSGYGDVFITLEGPPYVPRRPSK